MKTTDIEIKYRKNEDGKWLSVERGGRATRIIKSKKLYNRKKEKAIYG